MTTKVKQTPELPTYNGIFTGLASPRHVTETIDVISDEEGSSNNLQRIFSGYWSYGTTNLVNTGQEKMCDPLPVVES